MNQEGKEEATNNIYAILHGRPGKNRPSADSSGLGSDYFNAREGQISFSTKPELIGNFYQGIIHGGVISAAIDAAGGLTAYASALAGIKDIFSRRKRPIDWPKWELPTCGWTISGQEKALNFGVSLPWCAQERRSQ